MQTISQLFKKLLKQPSDILLEIKEFISQENLFFNVEFSNEINKIPKKKLNSLLEWLTNTYEDKDSIIFLFYILRYLKNEYKNEKYFEIMENFLKYSNTQDKIKVNNIFNIEIKYPYLYLLYCWDIFDFSTFQIMNIPWDKLIDIINKTNEEFFSKSYVAILSRMFRENNIFFIDKFRLYKNEIGNKIDSIFVLRDLYKLNVYTQEECFKIFSYGKCQILFELPEYVENFITIFRGYNRFTNKIITILEKPFPDNRKLLYEIFDDADVGEYSIQELKFLIDNFIEVDFNFMKKLHDFELFEKALYNCSLIDFIKLINHICHDFLNKFGSNWSFFKQAAINYQKIITNYLDMMYFDEVINMFLDIEFNTLSIYFFSNFILKNEPIFNNLAIKLSKYFVIANFLQNKIPNLNYLLNNQQLFLIINKVNQTLLNDNTYLIITNKIYITINQGSSRINIYLASFNNYIYNETNFEGINLLYIKLNNLLHSLTPKNFDNNLELLQKLICSSEIDIKNEESKNLWIYLMSNIADFLKNKHSDNFDIFIEKIIEKLPKIYINIIKMNDKNKIFSSIINKILHKNDKNTLLSSISLKINNDQFITKCKNQLKHKLNNEIEEIIQESIKKRKMEITTNEVITNGYHMCSICLDYSKNINTFYPCGHSCCSICFDRMYQINRESKCQDCRTNITKLIKVYQKSQVEVIEQVMDEV